MAPVKVDVKEEWFLGPEATPFFSKRWFPASGEPDAYVIFVHGFAEHIQRYDAYFRRLASHNIHIFAFDQRGHGATAHKPLANDDPIIVGWKNDGKKPHIDRSMKHRTGGWGKAIPDIEYFVKQESERAKAHGKKLFLYGHSMGGGLVLGFATRPHPPPSAETLSLLSGVIASGPFIASGRPYSLFQNIQLKLSSMLVGLLGNTVVPAPLDVKDLTHDVDVQKATEKDPMCVPQGSMRSLHDMVTMGGGLNTHASWDAWPKDLPLLLYHGASDPICCPKAAVRFGDMVVAKDKTTKLLPDLLHEPHNELAPAPENTAELVSDWIHKRVGGSEAEAPTVSSPPAAAPASTATPASVPTATATATVAPTDTTAAKSEDLAKL